MPKRIKPEDLEYRTDMTSAELLQQNDDLRTSLTDALTRMGAAQHKLEAFEIDNRLLQERVEELSKFETMDKVLTLEENARLQNQHAEDARCIEHLTHNVDELHKRIVALEGCLTRAHEAILTAQIVEESYKNQD